MSGFNRFTCCALRCGVEWSSLLSLFDAAIATKLPTGRCPRSLFSTQTSTERLRYGRVQHACVCVCECVSLCHIASLHSFLLFLFVAQLVSLFSQSADLRNRVTFATAQAIHSLFHTLEQYDENINESDEEDEDAMFKHIRCVFV